jgi:lysophospholipase L1-like esterase
LRSVAQRLVLVGLGVALAAVLLEAGLRIAGAAFLAMQASRNRAAHAGGDGTLTVLCIGESTTALGGADSYPTQLQEVLRARGRHVAVVNRGVPAITTDYIVSHLPAWIAEDRPAVVVAMMGVNDPPDEALGPTWKQAVRSLRVAKLVAWIADGLGRRFARPPETPAARVARTSAAATAHPNDADVQAELAEALLAQQRAADARAAAERALAIRPGDTRLRLLHARTLYAAGEPARAVALLDAIAAESPADGRLQVAVATEHMLGGNLEKARALLAVHPDAFASELLEAGYYQRAAAALAAGRPDDAARILDETERALPTIRLGYLLHQHRAFVARARGDEATFQAELATVQRLLAARGSSTTRRNFAALHRLLRDMGVPLVAVQYPLRPLDAIETLLDHDPGIVFVDNERLFRDMLAGGPWSALFTDTFAGDFGHLNRAGNRLLAENVADGVERALDASRAGTPPPVVPLEHGG